MDFGSLSRNITWPAGFAVIMLVFGILALLFRRRSAVWSALMPQFWTAAVVMILATIAIALGLPPELAGGQ